MATYKRMTAKEKFEYIKKLYHERLEQNPRAYEDVENIFRIAKLQFCGDEEGAAIAANNYNGMSNADFWDIIMRRWSESVRNMKSVEKFQPWKNDLEELEYALDTDSFTFYECLKQMDAVLDDWDAYKTDTEEKESIRDKFHEELRSRFLAQLRTTRNDKQLRCFQVDADEMIRALEEEDVVSGLARIKDLI